MTDTQNPDYSVRSGNLPADQFEYPTDHPATCYCEGVGTILKSKVFDTSFEPCDCDAATNDFTTTNHPLTCAAVPCPFGDL